MRFIQTHAFGSDCTATYDVEDYQAETAVEFINEMLQQCKKTWGGIEVWAVNRHLPGRVDYKHGELLKEIPDEWRNKEVVKVIAAGGWGYMNYRIYVNT